MRSILAAMLAAVVVIGAVAAGNAAPTTTQAAKPAVTAMPSASSTTLTVTAKWVFAQAAKTLSAAQSASYKATISLPAFPGASNEYTITGTMQKPNEIQEIVSSGGAAVATVVVGSSKGYVIDNAGKRYAAFDTQDAWAADVRTAAVNSYKMLGMGPCESLIQGMAVFSPQGLDMSSQFGQENSWSHVYNYRLRHQPVYRVVETVPISTAAIRFDTYVNQTTFAPVELSQSVESRGQTQRIFTLDFDSFAMSATAADPALFEYKPAADMTAYTPPAQDTGEKALLANGAAAPDFTVAGSGGKSVKLSDYSGKVVVIDFWATWCEPCQMSLPITDRVAAKYAPKGVVFLPVCTWDDKASFDKWIAAHKSFKMRFFFDPAGRDGDKSIASSHYSVSGIPTQYVIGKDGKVAASFVGYDPDTTQLTKALDQALAGTQ